MFDRHRSEGGGQAHLNARYTCDLSQVTRQNDVSCGTEIAPMRRTPNDVTVVSVNSPSWVYLPPNSVRTAHVSQVTTV